MHGKYDKDFLMWSLKIILYFKKISPAVLFCHQEWFSEDHVNVEFDTFSLYNPILDEESIPNTTLSLLLIRYNLSKRDVKNVIHSTNSCWFCPFCPHPPRLKNSWSMNNIFKLVEAPQPIKINMDLKPISAMSWR